MGVLLGLLLFTTVLEGSDEQRSDLLRLNDLRAIKDLLRRTADEELICFDHFDHSDKSIVNTCI